MLKINKILSRENKSLLSEMVRTDFKLRYQESVLGYVWSLLRPLLMSATLYFVFSGVFGLGDQIPNFGSYLLLGIMCWTFFSEMTSVGVGAIVEKGDLIRKIAIPRYLAVVSSSISALINFTLNFFVLAFIMTIAGADIQWSLMVFLPILVIELYLFSLAISFILAAAYVKYRDVSFIWEVLLQMLFYMTPILYPISIITDKVEWGGILLINPVAQIIQDMRFILITDAQPTTWSLLGLSSLIVPVFVVGMSCFAFVYFKKESVNFAENV